MAKEVVATFAGPLNAGVPAAVLTVASDSGLQPGLRVDRFGISGRTAKFPITWDSFAAAPASGDVVAINGVESEVVVVTLQNFNAGESATFSVDADLTSDPNPPNPSVVRVGDIEGATATVVFSDNTTAFGVFQPNGNDLRAVIS